MTATATRPSSRKPSDVVLDRDREPATGATGSILQVPLELIDVDSNVRKAIAQESLEELAASIREHGVRQPISLRDIPGDRYAINFGQRRFLASQLAERATIPAFVDNEQRTPEQLAIHQLIENLHRADLAPLDSAAAMRTVVQSGVTQAELARMLGIGASTVTNTIGLLDAPAKVREAIVAGLITPAHAKAIKGLAVSDQEDLLQEALDEHLTAHELEEAVQQHKEDAEWRAKREAENLEQARAAAERYEQKIAELATKVAKDTPIRTSGATYGDGAAKLTAVEERIRELGFTNVTRGRAEARPKGHCDCTAWKVELGWNAGLTVTPACIVAAHTEAKWQADRKADNDERERQKRIQGHIQGLVTTEALELFHRSPLVARVVLWTSFDWALNDWVRDHKGERKKPDAWDEISSLPEGELAVELSRFVAKAFTDRFNVKLDWARIAAELGLDEDGNPIEPKAARPEAAPAAPACGQLVVDSEAKYRIQKIAGTTVHLAADGRQWRNNPVVARTKAEQLTWDADAKAWSGATTQTRG